MRTEEQIVEALADYCGGVCSQPSTDYCQRHCLAYQRQDTCLRALNAQEAYDIARALDADDTAKAGLIEARADVFEAEQVLAKAKQAAKDGRSISADAYAVAWRVWVRAVQARNEAERALKVQQAALEALGHQAFVQPSGPGRPNEALQVQAEKEQQAPVQCRRLNPMQ